MIVRLESDSPKTIQGYLPWREIEIFNSKVRGQILLALFIPCNILSLKILVFKDPGKSLLEPKERINFGNRCHDSD